MRLPLIDSFWSEKRAGECETQEGRWNFRGTRKEFLDGNFVVLA